MLSTAPSPTLHSQCHTSNLKPYGCGSLYNSTRRSPKGTSSNIADLSQSNPRPITRFTVTSEAPNYLQANPEKYNGVKTAVNKHSVAAGRPRMVDAATQYSPPDPQSRSGRAYIPTSDVVNPEVGGGGDISNEVPTEVVSELRMESTQFANDPSKGTPGRQGFAELNSQRQKRPAHEEYETVSTSDSSPKDISTARQEVAAPKRLRPESPPARLMPLQYEDSDPKDLVILISSMLMELIRYNDALPLRDGHLTRFHSRAPPGISVLDYLQRLTTHTTLSPPILLSMVYYIDRLCAMYPSFTISSLTVHRFLITSATVASKGLSDSFWTNKVYARTGGVSMKELALLELEFLGRVEWRIIPRPEVLVDYYRSLIERSDGYELDVKGQVPGDTKDSS